MLRSKNSNTSTITASNIPPSFHRTLAPSCQLGALSLHTSCPTSLNFGRPYFLPLQRTSLTQLRKLFETLQITRCFIPADLGRVCPPRNFTVGPPIVTGSPVALSPICRVFEFQNLWNCDAIVDRLWYWLHPLPHNFSPEITQVSPVVKTASGPVGAAVASTAPSPQIC